MKNWKLKREFKQVLSCLLFLAVIPRLHAEQTTIRMMAGPAWGIPPKEATDPRSLARRAIFEEFHRRNPDLRVVNAGGLEIKGERAESGFLMSMAGDTAPDVFYVNFRQYYNYIDQGFARPLDDLIKRSGVKGQQSTDLLSRINPDILKVLKSYDGKIYAMPYNQFAQGLYYRKDHFKEAGLDPNRPPQNWDEFYRYAQKLVESKPGRIGFEFGADPGSKAYHWTDFVWQAGANVVEPAENGIWHSTVASPGGAKALDFYRKLMTEKWVGKNGKTYGPVATASTTRGQDIAEGRTSMWFSYTNDVVLNMSDLNPDLLGIAAMPAGPAGRANEINAAMWAINATIKDPKKVDACWRFIQFFSGEEAAKINTQRFVELGLEKLVNPSLLRKYGYADLAGTVDPKYVKANEELFSTGHPEPYGRNCQQVYVVLDNALDRAVIEPNTPAIKILQDISKEMDRKLLGYTPPEILRKQRLYAYTILAVLALIGASFGVFAWRKFAADRKSYVRLGGTPMSLPRFMMWCLLPAVLSIFVWAYYPLARGLVIAFQDYRIVQGSRWVGVDNFISVFTQPIFYKALWNSFVYVGLSILIGFFIPIFLAISLNEIPRAKVFFRTVYYLPAMTSPILVAFLWRQFYDKSETGLLNVILSPFINLLNPLITKFGWAPILPTHDWLGDPSLAMFAVVLPGIWAGAGPGSILYLAALKNIPDERYEAADLDGANWWHKIRFITVPGLKPLILINLLGVFIAGFKAMENVFVLTGGGPLYSTHTLGLEIWTNAFMFLKFGYATAAAWVMGTILIGFTLFQIKNLLRMRFTTAK